MIRISQKNFGCFLKSLLFKQPCSFNLAENKEIGKTPNLENYDFRFPFNFGDRRILANSLTIRAVVLHPKLPSHRPSCRRGGCWERMELVRGEKNQERTLLRDFSDLFMERLHFFQVWWGVPRRCRVFMFLFPRQAGELERLEPRALCPLSWGLPRTTNREWGFGEFWRVVKGWDCDKKTPIRWEFISSMYTWCVGIP